MPHLLGFEEDPEAPLLLLEDLGQGFWPPPWTEEGIDGVLKLLADVRGYELNGLPKLSDIVPRGNWHDVASGPDVLLKFHLVTKRWLDKSLPLLVAAEASAPFEGNALPHGDVRSDNICFSGGRALLVDWNTACYGNPDFDVAGWLPSLEAEGGPRPESILPDAGGFAAYLSGFFAARAGFLLATDDRNIQLSHLRSALPWAVRELGLPPLDGPKAPAL